MPAVDADVVFVAEGWDCEIDARGAIPAGLGFGVFDCPAGVAVFLAQLGWLCRPLRGNAAFLYVALFALGIALLGCGDNRGVDDLPAHRQKSSRRERRIKALKQGLDRWFPRKLGARQRLTKAPDRIGVWHRISEVQPEKTHKRQPVADQVFGALVRQIVAGLQNQRFEHQHVIERRAAAFRAVRAWHRAFEIRPEQREIHHRIQPFQAVALGRELLQPLVNVEKPALSPHPRPPARTPAHRITDSLNPPGYWRSPARDELRHVVGFSAADEIEKLERLKNAGTISNEEYTRLRARVMQ